MTGLPERPKGKKAEILHSFHKFTLVSSEDTGYNNGITAPEGAQEDY